MAQSSYSLAKIHLPENKTLTKRLEKLSLLISLLVLLLGTAILFSSQVVGVLFILATIPLFLEGRLGPFHVTNKNSKYLTFFYLAASIVCSLMVIMAGIVFIFGLGLTYVKQINLSAGFSFLFIGVALILPRTKALIRFHITHLFSFTILITNSMAVLGYLYLKLSPTNTNVFYPPIILAVSFVLLCTAILFRSPARGLVGIFTADSISSMFALKLLVANMASIFLLGTIVLIGMRIGVYNSYEAAAALVILLIVSSVVFAWINIKLLYRFELERFVMKEELRVHNIDLKLGNEELVGKMSELQEKNEEYADKLRHQEKYKDVTASLG